MLSLRISSSAASSGDESESRAAKGSNAMSPIRSTPAPATSPSPVPALSPPPTLPPGGKAIRVRGRRETEDLFLRMEQERRREVAVLAERRPVSRFPFRGRIQSLIRLRTLRREVATIKHQQCSRKSETDMCQRASNRSLKNDQGKRRLPAGEAPPRQEDECQLAGESEFLEDEKGRAHPRDLSEDRSRHEVKEVPNDRRCEENRHGSELESSAQSLIPSQTCSTPLSVREDTEESASPDASGDERSSWGNAIDWRRPSDSPSLQAQIAESAERNWLSEPPTNSWKGWGVIRRSFFNDLANMKFAENREIRELLEMKTVSTSLASDFSVTMNRMIQSFLRRREGREELDKQRIWRFHSESSSDQEMAATSSSSHLNSESLQSISLPLPTSEVPQSQGGRSGSSYRQISAPNAQDGDDARGVNNSVGQIHQELSELRKLVETCVDWHKRLEFSIKQEVLSAVNQLGTGNQLHNPSCMQVKKDSCCICCEAQVDSLLYRCGHMCACYKCAQELQWSSGRCPICRSTIADVIRAYPNS